MCSGARLAALTAVGMSTGSGGDSQAGPSMLIAEAQKAARRRYPQGEPFPARSYRSTTSGFLRLPFNNGKGSSLCSTKVSSDFLFFLSCILKSPLLGRRFQAQLAISYAR